jgi:hypothetical protein
VANEKKTPERAGTWERFDSGALRGKSTRPRGWLPLEPDATQTHRSHLLLAFAALGGLLILLSLSGPIEDATADPWLLSTRVIAAFFQLFVFALLLFLSIQAPGGYRRLMWLSLFFAGSLLHTLQHLESGPLRQYLFHLSIATWSPALLGYGSALLWKKRTRHHLFEWVTLGTWLLLLVVLTFFFAYRSPTPPPLVLTLGTLALLPFPIYLVAALSGRLSIAAAAPRDRPVRIILFLLLGLYALQIVIGALNPWTDFSEAARVAHLAVGSAIWALLVVTTFASQYRPQVDLSRPKRRTRRGRSGASR